MSAPADDREIVAICRQIAALGDAMQQALHALSRVAVVYASRQSDRPTPLPQPAPASVAATAQYLRTPEAAAMLGISPRTLEKYRCQSGGPAFRKLGGRVVYAPGDLRAWVERATCRSTSDPRYVEARTQHATHDKAA